MFKEAKMIIWELGCGAVRVGGGSGKERLSISMDLAAGRKIRLLSAGSSHCYTASLVSSV